MKILELKKSVTESNDEDARDLRKELLQRKILLVNLMSSAGAGKTTLLMKLAQDMRKSTDIAVIEADIASDTDAVKLNEAGIKSVQVHTDGMCHMDAGMTKRAVEELEGPDPDIIFENQFAFGVFVHSSGDISGFIVKDPFVIAVFQIVHITSFQQ